MDQRIVQKFLMSLVVITTFTSTLSLERRSKHIDPAESSHLSHWTNSPRNRPTIGDNRIAESGRRFSQMLTGHKYDKDDALWDDGILMSSAGNGKERKSSGDDDDEKKTLSQQVKEGKYGLIQNELYPEEPKRPGIISYLSNSEVPKDTIKTLGGLDEDEIWLAENHVLVLRGGNFPEHETANHDSGSQKWPPIDNYEAPRRQVKIPNKPKVPPPFPIQLSDGGPIQIIGSNGNNTRENVTMDYESLSSSKGFLPGEGPFFSNFPPSDSLASPDLIKSVNGSRGIPEKKGKSDPPLGIPGPFFPALPPGAVFVPPPGNMSDYDDDDQSIYYPPPYSFVYPQDNTTTIPPGPLVPGIILPPPADFFSPLEEKATTKEKTKRPTTPIPKARPTYFPSRKTGTKLYKTTTATTLSPIKVGSLPITTKSYLGKSKFKNTTHKPFFVEVTTSKSDKSTTHSSGFGNRPAIGNTIESSTVKNSWASVVSSKNIPLSAYYATTIPSSVDQSVEATPASIKSILTTKHSGRVPSKASYYFYEEATEEPSTVNPSHYYRTTTEAPFFKVETLPPTQERNKYYDVEMLPSRETSKDVSVKLIDSIVKDPQVFHYTEAEQSTSERENLRENPSLRDNFPRRERPRMLSDNAPVFYGNIPSRAPITLNSYFTTPKPKSYYREETTEQPYSKSDRKPKPIYQFSFEAAGYSKRDKQKQKQQQQELASYNEYQDIQTVSDQYDYEGTEAVPEQKIRTERIPLRTIPYKTQTFFHTTASPFSDTTMDPHQAYFTKQDEQLLDDVTKEYFTAFGKKLTSKSQSTTPLYGKSSTVTEKPKYSTYVSTNYDLRHYKTSKIKVHYGDQSQGPFSLKDDTLVNYRHPLPPINPDSEFITVGSQPVSQEYQHIIPVENQVRDYRPQPIRTRPSYSPIRNYGSQRIQQTRDPNDFVPISDPRVGLYPTRPVSLEGDTAVNYRNPRPPINPDAEFITPVRNSEADKTSSYFAYRLPGDGGHFYFLTPQAIAQRQDEGGYVYAKPRTSRLLRRRRGPASNV